MAATRKSDKKLWFIIHGWIGVQLGLMLFIILFTGTLATLSNEIDWLLNPALRVTPTAERASWGEMYTAAQQAYPKGSVFGITAPLNAYAAAEAIVNPTRAKPTVEDMRRVYINPYTAEVQGTAGRFTIQRVLRDFHRNLSMPGFGSYLVESFGLLLLAAVITPLFFYKRWWRAFYTLRLTSGLRIFWSDLHRFIGMWSLWFTLLIGLTVVWYLAESLLADTGAMRLGDLPEVPPKISAHQLASYADDAQPLPLDTLVAKAKQAYPGLKIASISFPRTPGAAVNFTGHADAMLVRTRANRVFLNPYDGSVMGLYKAEQLPLLYRWLHTADPLHFGDFGGLISKIIWALFGFGTSGLVLTGTYLWFRRTQQQWIQVKRQRPQLALKSEAV